MRRLLPALVLLAFAVPAAPAEEPGPPLTRIAFGSCADQDKPLPIFDTIAAARPELLLLTGDNIYADLDRTRKVTPEVIKEKYDTLAKLPGYQKLKAACPILATWDDHDFGKNDAGTEWVHKDDAQKLFLDFFGAKGDDPRRGRKGVYTSAVYGPPGKRVQVILLDTRYHRSPLKKAPYDTKSRIAGYLPDPSNGVTVLGAEQWKWLEGELKKPAEVRLLVSSIQVVADEHPFEKWANFPKERERLYALVRSTGANGVVILSGDRHHAEVSLDPKEAVGYPLYDVTSSGLNQANKGWRAPDKNTHRLAGMPYGDNFGMVLIDWAGDDPRLTLQVRDEDGDVTCGVKVRLSTLRASGAAVAGTKEYLPGGILTPAEAAKKVGEKVTVQFAVASTGGQTNLYLNSAKDFRSKENFAVVLTPKAKTGSWENATGSTFQGKTIRATGTVRMNRDNAQIEVTEEGQLQVVEK